MCEAGLLLLENITKIPQASFCHKMGNYRCNVFSQSGGSTRDYKLSRVDKSSLRIGNKIRPMYMVNMVKFW